MTHKIETHKNASGTISVFYNGTFMGQFPCATSAINFAAMCAVNAEG